MGAIASEVKRQLLARQPVILALFGCMVFLALGGLTWCAHNLLLDGASSKGSVPVLRLAVMALASQIRPMLVMQVPPANTMTDVLWLLGATAVGLPLLHRYGLSSLVLGFLGIGIVIGPSGLDLISNLHLCEELAEVGIYFFLCEMGLELSFDRLQNMKRDVFGLGLAQFALTSIAILIACQVLLGLNYQQACIVGCAMALSSSAFVLQLLDETKERGTVHGRAAFGILLFQDLVVPLLLVFLPMLGSTASITGALSRTLVRSVFALALAFGIGRLLLERLFSGVAESKSAVSMRALSFFTVFGMCYMFELCGLSKTLGAFLAGVLLAETAFQQEVDRVISPIREDLLGLFFITVGFGIDLRLVLTHPILVLSAVSALLAGKTLVTMVVCRISGLGLGNSQQIGLLLSQAGEFSFVMFGIAQSIGAFTPEHTRLLLTITSLSMATTPALARIGRELSNSLQSMQQEPPSEAIDINGELASAQVIICGYGRVGKLVGDLLNTKFVPWIAFEADPDVVMAANKKDMPVFLGDMITLKHAVKDADINDKLLVVTPSDMDTKKQMVDSLRKTFPEASILVRDVQETTAKVVKSDLVIVPKNKGPEEEDSESHLVDLPISGTVLQALGYSEEDGEEVMIDVRMEDDSQEVSSPGGSSKSRTSPTLARIEQWYAERRNVDSEEEAEEAEEMAEVEGIASDEGEAQ